MTPRELVRLGDVATIVRKTISPERISDGTTYVGLENIERGGTLLNITSVSRGDLASTKFEFTADQVLFGKLRPYLAKIARPAFSGVCSTDILPITPGPRIDKNYLAQYLVTPDVVALAASRATGANLPRLSPGELAKFEIPLPPLAEQRRIAGILDLADSLRALRREGLADLDDLTQSIFLDMFGDPISNPRGYELRRLGEVLKFKSGNFLPASKMHAGAHAVLGGNGVNGWHDEYLFEDPQLVIGRVGVYCGCVHISPAKSWITDNALYVSERRPGLSLTYLGHALEQANLNQYASQSAQPLISASRINPVSILVPPLTVQEEFETVVCATDVVRQRMRASAAELDCLFSSLQSRAFAGEL